MNSLFNGSSELFEAYIALVRAALDDDFTLRRARTIRYEDAVAVSRATCERAVSLTASVYGQATGDEVVRYRLLRAQSQTLLNEEIQAANARYQAVEAPVFASVGTHDEVAALARRRDALIFAAGELDVPELEDEAKEQYEEARRALFAARDAALAEARALYQSEMAAMHVRHQERLRQYDLAEKAFLAPLAEQRERTSDNFRLAHSRLVTREERRATHDLAQLDRRRIQEEEVRLAELALLRRENFSAAASRRFLDYCEQSTQLLKERIKNA